MIEIVCLVLCYITGIITGMGIGVYLVDKMWRKMMNLIIRDLQQMEWKSGSSRPSA